MVTTSSKSAPSFTRSVNIVIPAAAMNKRGAFIRQRLSTTQSGLRELPAPFAGHRWAMALSSQSEVHLGTSTLRVMASRVGEISSAAQRDTEPAARVGAGVSEAPSGCQPVARRAARQRGMPGITQQAPEPPSVHAQREYRCPKGNSVFANGKNIVQAAGLNIVIPQQP